MHEKTNEKKLVEAFKTFFDKSISPYVNSNDSIMNEWKYFNKLISSEPVDYSQIQFYILLANKSQVNHQQLSGDYRSSTYGEQNQSKYNHTTPSQKLITQSNNSDKKINAKGYGSNSKKQQSSYPRRNLINSLQSFQSLLIKNQERLESFNRKDVTNQTAGSNAIKRYH